MDPPQFILGPRLLLLRLLKRKVIQDVFVVKHFIKLVK